MKGFMSMCKYAIEANNVEICYKEIKSFSIKKNLLTNKRNNAQVFKAIKGVSFKVEKGEILGLIGRNGSGKSTLLRAIAGIFSVDSGDIDLHGNTVSLLAIGVGFQKELTGRENILLSGMLLGFSEKEIRSREEEIIAFSELGEFIDKPVRTYSSGMYSKLSFAITAILETDIILIDEVLSVGDAKFKKKSYNKMKELIQHKDRTVVIVSHDRKVIMDLCDKLLWIDNGELIKYGSVEETLKEYDEYMSSAK